MTAATYPARVAQVAAALRDWACFGQAETVPNGTTRARAAKWLSRAFGRIPRPHMESVAPPGTWLPRLVGRVRQLEGELYHRLLHVKLDADPLPEEVRVLDGMGRKVKPSAIDAMLFIPQDWTGEPTVAGDYCLDALQEVLNDVRNDSPDAGQAHYGKGAAGLPRHQALDGLPVAPEGAANGVPRPFAQGLLPCRS